MKRQAKADRKRLERENKKRVGRRRFVEGARRRKEEKLVDLLARSSKPVPDPIRELVQRQLAAFSARFGRPPGPGEHLFFDPSEAEPRPLRPEALTESLLLSLSEALQADPELIEAMVRSGLVVRSAPAPEARVSEGAE